MTRILGPAQSWRLVHDGISVLMLEQLSGLTETANLAFEAQTVRECLAEIDRLGLPRPDEHPANAVPTSVSPRQIRQALTRAGMREAVESAVAAGDQDLKDWWEFATEFDSTNPQVLVVCAALGVTELQRDGLWTLAGTL